MVVPLTLGLGQSFQVHLFLSFAQEDKLLNLVVKTSSGVCVSSDSPAQCFTFLLLRKLFRNA